MKRLTLILAFTNCWMITPAPAGAITVLGTSATAATMSCNKQAPLFIQCSESVAAGTASAVADVLAGHLGALVGVSQRGYVAATAYMGIGIALNDMTPDDFLQIDMSLHGSFTNAQGNGVNPFDHAKEAHLASYSPGPCSYRINRTENLLNPQPESDARFRSGRVVRGAYKGFQPSC